VKRTLESALLGALFTALLLAQEAPPTEVQEPPEEDVATEGKTEYTFNPLQAAKELKIGGFYLKKGSYRAAVRRFQEALKWNPNAGEAYLRIGEAQTKLGDHKAAREAWSKYIEVEPESKEAESLRKKLGRK
jgi:tetratricopeptide (TPR) repeat protein